jgi:low affinity Fe/Cu permease
MHFSILYFQKNIQVAFKAEFSRQMRALQAKHKELGRKIIEAKNRLVQIEQAKIEGLAAVDQAAGHSGKQRSNEALVQDLAAESSDEQDNVSRRPRLESLRTRILSLFSR